jgi:hypothetical protein
MLVAAPTHHDAQLMVQLAQWGTTLGLQDAMSAVFDDTYDPAIAEVADRPVQVILTFGESVGALVKHDLFSRELLSDWLWIAGLWARVSPAALRAREELGEPRLYENFEALAQ